MSTPRRWSRLLVALLLVLLTTTSCSLPSNAPSQYDTITELNYLQGCVAGFGFDMAGAVDFESNVITYPEGSDEAQNHCLCVYEEASSPALDESSEPVLDVDGNPTTRIPFERFKDISEVLEKELPLEEGADIESIIPDDDLASFRLLKEITTGCGGDAPIPSGESTTTTTAPAEPET